jgi:phytoene dehydrogenase-like protein
VPFINKDFWITHKKPLEEKILIEFSKKARLNKNDIEVKAIATPITFYNWSFSYKGAIYGWAPSVSQVFPNFNLKTEIKNLYFVGHWLGMGHGISTVAYLGRNLANSILKRSN